MPVLEPDTSLELPRVTVLKASAGSGKTYALTERFVQFLLSERIPKNDLRNILAITFSNNASREMRGEVLGWLKRLHFRDPERLREIASVTAGGEEKAAGKAGTLVDQILSRFSDFQVQTIDSFMSTIFRASALDFGFSPEFEIVMDAEPLVDYAFNVFLREAAQGTDIAALLDETIRAVLGFKAGDDAFPWDPAAPLLAEMKDIGARLSLLDEHPATVDTTAHLERAEQRVRDSLEGVAGLVDASGLEANKKSTFPDIRDSVRSGRFSDLIGRGMKTCPVKKPGAKDAAGGAAYERILAAWEEADAAVAEYTGRWARAFYQPYLRLHGTLDATMEKVKRSQSTIVLSDIGRALGEYITNDIVPDVYFRIGERVWHFLIDEFQDTSPMQWRALFPLVENSLAMGGSLFVVGDTKQAIYGFRQADYTIMRGMETDNPFPSAGHTLRELTVNRRSGGRVLSFVSEVFRTNAPAVAQYREASRRSGLDEWIQDPRDGADPGYVEVQILDRDDENPPEREKLRQIMTDLHARGYAWGDIALLASKNDQIVRATSWLNEMGIPFLSFSSLDVRARRIAGELIALLSFLDSPPDDLAFATFLLGDIFSRTIAGSGTTTSDIRDFLWRSRGNRPLYKAFQIEFPVLWKNLFAGLFRSSGYLPLYDLVSEAYAVFDVFTRAPEEEATLAKLLEIVKEFEGSGSNSLRDFLGTTDDERGEWAIAVPRGADSVNAMTVHKAKGLGFPVVVALLYGESRRGFEYTVLREGGQVGLVKLTKAIADRDPTLAALYDEEEVRTKVESLNALYVALTRAKQEMYVVGVKRERDTFPFDLLPSAGFAPSDGKGPPPTRPPEKESPAGLRHEARAVPVSFARGRLGREERRRGELVHRICPPPWPRPPRGRRRRPGKTRPRLTGRLPAWTG